MDKAPPNASEGLERRITVLLAIVVIAVVFIAMAGVIYYRSALKPPPTPSAIIAVVGDESHKGTTVSVMNIEGTGISLQQKLAAGSDGRYTARFNVPPGEYTVRIETPAGIRQERALTVRDFDLYMQVKLSDLLSEPGPRRSSR